MQADNRGQSGSHAAAKSSALGKIPKILIGACAVIALVLVGYFGMSLALTGSFPSLFGQGTLTEEQREASYQSPYTWSNLDRSNGRYVYKQNGTVLSRLGVDVSENQGEIDWYQVINDGIEFAIVRVGYRGTSTGAIFMDDYFTENIDGAQYMGLDVGVYFFSQATTVAEAQEEADFVLQCLNGRSLEYPVFYDCEEVAAGAGESRTSGLTKDEMTECAKAFCQRIEQAGYTAMIYGNSSDLSRYSLSSLSNYGIWYAEYGTPVPTIKRDFTIWQYSNGGTVAGINAAVDMDIDLTQAYQAAKK